MTWATLPRLLNCCSARQMPFVSMHPGPASTRIYEKAIDAVDEGFRRLGQPGQDATTRMRFLPELMRRNLFASTISAARMNR